MRRPVLQTRPGPLRRRSTAKAIRYLYLPKSFEEPGCISLALYFWHDWNQRRQYVSCPYPGISQPVDALVEERAGERARFVGDRDYYTEEECTSGNHRPQILDGLRSILPEYGYVCNNLFQLLWRARFIETPPERGGLIIAGSERRPGDTGPYISGDAAC